MSSFHSSNHPDKPHLIPILLPILFFSWTSSLYFSLCPLFFPPFLPPLMLSITYTGTIQLLWGHRDWTSSLNTPQRPESSGLMAGAPCVNIPHPPSCKSPLLSTQVFKHLSQHSANSKLKRDHAWNGGSQASGLHRWKLSRNLQVAILYLRSIQLQEIRQEESVDLNQTPFQNTMYL